MSLTRAGRSRGRHRTISKTRAWRRYVSVLTSLCLLFGVPVGLTLAQAPAMASVKAGDVIFEDYVTHEIEQLSGSTVTKLGPGMMPDVSPDGSRIAFISSAPGNGGLEVMNTDGSNVTQIDFPTTNNPDDTIADWYPRWSPDGQWIVFAKEEPYEWPNNNWQIFKVRPDGSDLTDLTKSTGSGTSEFPSWSPDGSKIVYSYDADGTGRYRLAIMNADGSDSHFVDANSSGTIQVFPVWSPDGARIYFTNWSPDHQVRYYTSSDGFSGTDAALNTFDGGNVFEWAGSRLSADGSTLYYTGSDSSGQFQLFSVSTGRSVDPTQLTPSGGDLSVNPSPVGQVSPTCPSLTMIAARGSDELPQGDGPNGWTVQSAYTKDPDKGVGHELYVLYTALHQAYPALMLDPVMYPADAVFPDLVTGVKVYRQSVASGASTILTDIQRIDSACGSRPHHYILGGYSQGAWVIHDALHQMTSKQLSEISGAALFGDPDFIPFYKPWVRDYKLLDIFAGSAAPFDRGNTSIPAAIVPHTASYCFPDDPVCQTWPGTIATTLKWCIIGSVAKCPHFRYVLRGEVAKAAAFLIPFLPSH